MQDHEVTVIDNLLYERISLVSYISNSKFTFIKGDVRDDELLKQLVPKYDIIIPLAALVGANLCKCNPTDSYLINYRHVKFINDIRSKHQRILYPNTNSGYGITDNKEIITEESVLLPISIYGKTKCEAEEEIKQSENYTILRLATVFGISKRPRFDLLINNLVLKAIKEKVIVLYESHAIRNYIHIQDICRAFVHVIDSNKTIDEVFNVGNDFLNCSKLDLVEKIKSIIPLEIIKAEYTKDEDKRDYRISSEKFYKTGFICLYDIEYGINELKKLVDMIDEPKYANY